MLEVFELVAPLPFHLPLDVIEVLPLQALLFAVVPPGLHGTTDRQIGRLVYELYGLTEDEVAVVEGVV